MAMAAGSNAYLGRPGWAPGVGVVAAATRRTRKGKGCLVWLSKKNPLKRAAAWIAVVILGNQEIADIAQAWR